MIKSITLTVQGPAWTGKGYAPTREVMKRFEKEGGDKMVEGVQGVLGTRGIYPLNPDYAASKPTRTRGKRIYKHVPGKPADQPLIFTTEMYEAVEARGDGAGIILDVKSGQAISERGIDYAAKWEAATEFLEKGFDVVEAEVADMLERIIIEEMGL